MNRRRFIWTTLLGIASVALLVLIFSWNNIVDRDGDENSVEIEEVTLNVPSGVKGVKSADNSNVLHWENVDLAKKYYVYRSPQNDDEFAFIGESDSTTYVDDDIIESQTYFYYVVAVNGENQSAKSEIIELEAISEFAITETTEETLTSLDIVEEQARNNANITNETTSKPREVTKQEETTKAETNPPAVAKKTTPTKQAAPTPKQTAPAPISTPAPTAPKEKIIAAPVEPTTVSKAEQEQAKAENPLDKYRHECLNLVNAERTKRGLSKLSMPDNLIAPADKRASETISTFSHTRPNGSAFNTVFSEYNISVRSAGENIAYGYQDANAVMTGWMNSEGHRANILEPNFKNIGIGVVEKNGVLYWTQLFTN